MIWGAYLDAVRSNKPLVHNITNLVVNNIAANALLAVGASPVMAYAQEEVADMVGIAQALSLNMGTLTPDVVEAMCLAGQAANRAHVPVIFDPVGIGATPYRTRVAREMTHDVRLAVLRGNAAELSVFLDLGGQMKGVDAVSASQFLPQAMAAYAQEHGTVLVATGEVDYVTDGQTLWKLHNGHPLLSAITGSGCMLTALLGAFVGIVEKKGDLRACAQACVAGITTYNVAAELAAEKSNGPGTFQTHLFDALFSIDRETVDARARVDEQEVRA